MNIFRHYPALAPPCNCGRGRDRRCKIAGGRNVDSKFRDSHISGNDLSSEDGATKANTLMVLCRKGEQWTVSQCNRHVFRFRSVTTAAAKCEMRSIVIMIDQLPYRILIGIILIYRIIYRSKLVFDNRNSTRCQHLQWWRL